MCPPFSRSSTGLAGCQIPCKSGWLFQVLDTLNADFWPSAGLMPKPASRAATRIPENRIVIVDSTPYFDVTVQLNRTGAARTRAYSLFRIGAPVAAAGLRFGTGIQ